MSIVKSFRFSDLDLDNLETGSSFLGVSEAQFVKLAMDRYLEEIYEGISMDLVRCDFEMNTSGINSPLVQEFIKQVNMNTDFTVNMYEDGHSVSFRKVED